MYLSENGKTFFSQAMSELCLTCMGQCNIVLSTVSGLKGLNGKLHNFLSQQTL
jgi:hypothetical protein